MNEFRKLLKSESGQILQAGIAALVTIGATLVAVNVNQEQKKQQLRNQYVVKTTEIEARIRNAIRSDAGWAATVADPANTHLDCMKTTGDGDCAGDGGFLARVYDETGTNLLVENANWQGFTPSGEKCNGFVSDWNTNGNAQCPFGVRVSYQAVDRGFVPPDRTDQSTIPAVPACSAEPCDTRIVVLVRLNSDRESQVGSHGTNLANYYVDFSREESSKQEEIVIVDRKGATNGGTCTVDNWVTRDLNLEITDTGGNATVAGNNVTLTAGTYSCEATVPMGVSNRHQARIAVDQGGAQQTFLLGTSAYYYTPSFVKGTFTITSSVNLTVQHLCKASSATTEDFGLASGTSNTYTVLRCVKKDE